MTDADALASLIAQGIDPEILLKALRAERAKRTAENKLASYHPYKKQIEFHAAGKTHKERLLIAANQVGKTIGGGAESAMHLTGLYPDDWKGARFNRAVRMWASGVTGLATRDNVQSKLIGPPEREEQWGTGYIPKRCLKGPSGKPWTRAMGTANLLDSCSVLHIPTNTYSTVWFKSYEQGREKWQGPTLDIVWFDEEPPPEIYSEGLTRTNAVADAITYLTFTPLLGMSEVVRMFLMPEGGPSKARHVTTMTIDDAEHFTPEQRQAIIDSYQPHEREARTKGIPTMGSGRVFPVAEELVREDAFSIPKHWPKIAGVDFGFDHPFAAAWLAWDRDADCIHVYDCYRVRQQTPLIHGAAIKARGAAIPVAWPHDGLQHDKGSGLELAQQYRNQGVSMLPERAQFPDDRGNGVEAGVIEMLDRMQTGKLKIAAHLNEVWEEFRLYHREDGKIVKEGDDILCAIRYAMMSLRFARTDAPAKDRYGSKPSRNSSSMAA